jgi:hypothetical protein
MRKARIGNLILKFICKDDSAIPLTGEDLDKAYEAYLESKDITTLKVDNTKGPCIYLLRPFTTQENWANARDALAALQGVYGDKAEEAESPEDLVASVGERPPEDIIASWSEYIDRARRALRDRIVGATAHPMVVGMSDTGELEERVFSWDENRPAPEGVLDDILLDENLVNDVFRFLLSAALLNATQKKH